jgi:hypothetical protein
MKKSIFTLALALLGMNGMTAANTGCENRNGKMDCHLTADEALIDPSTVFTYIPNDPAYTASEDRKITEASALAIEPLYYGLAMETVIAEDNKIIDSDFANQKIYPLDVLKKKRNSSVPSLKKR